LIASGICVTLLSVRPIWPDKLEIGIQSVARCGRPDGFAKKHLSSRVLGKSARTCWSWAAE